MPTVLVVDDDPSLRSAMRRQPNSAGYDVLEASDGEEAMGALAEHRVDLLLVDIFMPEVDGMELTIRVLRQMPDARIIAMSGGGTVDKHDALDIARRVGAIGTLTKPFTMEELLEAVRGVLGEGPSTAGRRP